MKYEEADIHRLAIMQDFPEIVKIKMADWQPYLIFFSVKFVMGCPCVRHYILYYIHGPVILHFLS